MLIKLEIDTEKLNIENLRKTAGFLLSLAGDKMEVALENFTDVAEMSNGVSADNWKEIPDKIIETLKQKKKGRPSKKLIEEKVPTMTIDQYPGERGHGMAGNEIPYYPIKEENTVPKPPIPAVGEIITFADFMQKVGPLVKNGKLTQAELCDAIGRVKEMKIAEIAKYPELIPAIHKEINKILNIKGEIIHE